MDASRYAKVAHFDFAASDLTCCMIVRDWNYTHTDSQYGVQISLRPGEDRTYHGYTTQF